MRTKRICLEALRRSPVSIPVFGLNFLKIAAGRGNLCGMKWFSFLLIAVAFAAGCEKKAVPPANNSATSAASSASVAPKVWEPTEAQPKLRTMKLWVGTAEITAELALQPREIQTGMMFRTNIPTNTGMLFVFNTPYQAQFWMKNCPLPLSAAYIDPDGTILELREFKPYNTNLETAVTDRVKYVLETGHGWFESNGIRPGMVFRTERGSLNQTFSQGGN